MLSSFSHSRVFNQQKIIRAALIGLTLTLLFSACSSRITTEPARSIDLVDCQLSMPGSSIRLDAQCGKLTVYEDRAAASGSPD